MPAKLWSAIHHSIRCHHKWKVIILKRYTVQCHISRWTMLEKEHVITMACCEKIFNQVKHFLCMYINYTKTSTCHQLEQGSGTCCIPNGLVYLNAWFDIYTQKHTKTSNTFTHNPKGQSLRLRCFFFHFLNLDKQDMLHTGAAGATTEQL